MVIRENWRKEFDGLGMDEVRRRLSRIFDPVKLEHAEAWLNEKEKGEERAYRRESNQTARSAKNAAWIAAIAAIIAAIFAAIAIILH